MRNYNEEEWKLIYAAWCVRDGDLPYKVAIEFADEAWPDNRNENPEVIAEMDLSV